MHLKRLASYGSAPARQALTAEIAQAIQAKIEGHGLDASTVERIDRITDLCDRIAFDFCLACARCALTLEGSHRLC